ncbi:MAG: S9 family peptidase [Promethearchaeota archaeon]|jgi:dipeptidyl aminopeptidase/acylaminoacyl peptidase
MKVPIIMDYDIDKNFKTLLFNSNISGLPLIYSVPVDLSQEPKQINSGKEPVMIARIAPKGNNLIYFQDEAGNEIFQLYLLPTKGGKPKRLTDTDQRTFTIDWHPRGKEIARSYVSMIAPGIEIINLETGEGQPLKEPSPLAVDLHYSPNGKWIALTNMKGYTNSEVMIINRKDPSDSIVYNKSNKSMEGGPAWSPDDKKLAYLSDSSGWRKVVIQEFQGEEQVILDLEKDEEVLAGFDAVVWNPNSDTVYYLVSKYGRTTMHSHRISGNRSPPLPFPQGTLLSPKIRKDGKFLTVLHSSMVSPFGVYLHEIGTNYISPLTSRNFEIDLSHLKEPRSVWYESFDGRKIHSWYMPGIDAKPPYPGAVHPHGGPWAQLDDSWSSGINFHLGSLNGLGVLGPNFRGSTGYGKEFQFLDIRDPGGGDLEDIVYGAEWLKQQPEIDNNKIGIFGGSYGGFMTLIALTKKPAVFSAGIAMVPVADWIEDYKLADAVFKLFDTTLFGGPQRGKYKELYMDRSPITHIKNIKAPVLIMAGKTDTRCPWPPIEKFIDKLKEMNHPHEVAIEEKAGHISASLNHSEIIPIVSQMIEFLNKTLKQVEPDLIDAI